LRIALVSDSHGKIPGELLGAIAGADRIFHLGDLGPVHLLYELETVAPVAAVQGNNDAPGQSELPPLRRFEESGVHFHLRHFPWNEHSMLQATAPSIFLHGHTHKPRIEEVPLGFQVCPGSLRLPRGGFPPSYGWIILEDASLRISLRSLQTREIIDERIAKL
jgi:uncharacterized protein